jgi:hypothetical protein
MFPPKALRALGTITVGLEFLKGWFCTTRFGFFRSLKGRHLSVQELAPEHSRPRKQPIAITK